MNEFAIPITEERQRLLDIFKFGSMITCEGSENGGTLAEIMMERVGADTKRIVVHLSLITPGDYENFLNGSQAVHVVNGRYVRHEDKRRVSFDIDDFRGRVTRKQDTENIAGPALGQVAVDANSGEPVGQITQLKPYVESRLGHVSLVKVQASGWTFENPHQRFTYSSVVHRLKPASEAATLVPA